MRHRHHKGVPSRYNIGTVRKQDETMARLMRAIGVANLSHTQFASEYSEKLGMSRSSINNLIARREYRVDLQETLESIIADIERRGGGK